MLLFETIILKYVFLQWHNDPDLNGKKLDDYSLLEILRDISKFILDEVIIYKGNDYHDPSSAIGRQLECSRLRD